VKIGLYFGLLYFDSGNFMCFIFVLFIDICFDSSIYSYDIMFIWAQCYLLSYYVVILLLNYMIKY
jgi:hypothetical protein